MIAAMSAAQGDIPSCTIWNMPVRAFVVLFFLSLLNIEQIIDCYIGCENVHVDLASRSRDSRIGPAVSEVEEMIWQFVQKARKMSFEASLLCVNLLPPYFPVWVYSCRQITHQCWCPYRFVLMYWPFPVPDLLNIIQLPSKPSWHYFHKSPLKIRAEGLHSFILRNLACYLNANDLIDICGLFNAKIQSCKT